MGIGEVLVDKSRVQRIIGLFDWVEPQVVSFDIDEFVHLSGVCLSCGCDACRALFLDAGL